MTSTEELERELRRGVSAAMLQRHLDRFSTLFRDTGSDDERRAAEYVVEQLRGYGVEADLLWFDALISWPLAGALHILDGDGADGEEVFVRTRSFGAQTPKEGVVAELVHVPFEAPEDGAMIFSHRAVAGDYTGLDVRGKVVVTMDGGPDGIRRAQEHGAAGHLHIWPSDEQVTHEMIGTSVWGTPTPESARRLPAIPVLGVNHEAGMRLVDACRRGVVRVRLESNVTTRWQRVPVATGWIPGSGSDDFLLVGAHIDSWYEGITDNATGDAALLEMARVLAPRRAELRAGVRFCWWPGHSTGRYAGSTWYADEHFGELRRHCLGYLNIDSPGTRGSTVFDCRYNCGEVEAITEAAVRQVSDQEPSIRRPLRAGDQSFLGVGLPSLGAFRMLGVDHPDRKAVGGSGGAWWWHSPEDTLDKADVTVLVEDVEIYLAMTARMCTPALIPYDFRPVARDFLQCLELYQE
ncbi:MAG: M28 family peptidase, partial [Candidatus Dormiibacterota bacterium]